MILVEEFIAYISWQVSVIGSINVTVIMSIADTSLVPWANSSSIICRAQLLSCKSLIQGLHSRNDLIFIDASSVSFHGVHYSSGRELTVGVGREMKESGFSSTRFLTVSMFYSTILVREGPGSLEGETSPEATNLLITLEKA